MPKTLHPSERTTPAIRKAIQKNNLTIQALANKYAISQGTVLKWKHRQTVEDRKHGPTSPRSTRRSYGDSLSKAHHTARYRMSKMISATSAQ